MKLTPKCIYNFLAVTRALALVCLLGLAGSVAALSAQESPTGSVRGTVVDQTGRAVEGTAIAIRGLLHGSHAAVTNAEGQFTIAELPPDTYSVQASAAGFAASEQQVTVTAGNTTEIS